MSKSFSQLGIRPALIDKLKELGIAVPTPVQASSIPLLLSGVDVIAQAQTGTGKTLAFALPLLETIDTNKTTIQGLILTPTRELAIQITSELQKLAPVVEARILAAYGGQDVARQLRKLEGSVHIVVATPGRLLDHLRRGSIELHKVNMLILDEADQMLHMGFLPDVEEILSAIPARRQTLLFSATMPQPIRNIAKQYMRTPEEVKIETKQVTVKDISQLVIQTNDRGKQDALFQAIDEFRPYLAMIFCRTKKRANALNEALQLKGYASDELHGDLSQAKREQVMKRFRDAKIQLLVATDVAARGLDVEGVTHIFNYDIPADAESYIHRIGRTGRAGQKGMAVTFATVRDGRNLQIIEKGIDMVLRKRSASGQDVAQQGARPERSLGSDTRTSGGLGRRGAEDRPGAAGSGRRGERGRAGGAGGRRDERGRTGTTSGWGGREDRPSAAGSGRRGADGNAGAAGGKRDERGRTGTTSGWGGREDRPSVAGSGRRGASGRRPEPGKPGGDAGGWRSDSKRGVAAAAASSEREAASAGGYGAQRGEDSGRGASAGYGAARGGRASGAQGAGRSGAEGWQSPAVGGAQRGERGRGASAGYGAQRSEGGRATGSGRGASAGYGAARGEGRASGAQGAGGGAPKGGRAASSGAAYGGGTRKSAGGGAPRSGSGGAKKSGGRDANRGRKR